MPREVIAVDVGLELPADTDPRAAGGEVTVALCGSWEHDGPCRWPHNSRIETDSSPAHLRTLVVFPDHERGEVLERIETALRSDERWSVVRFAAEAIADDERALAHRLAEVARDEAADGRSLS